MLIFLSQINRGETRILTVLRSHSRQKVGELREKKSRSVLLLCNTSCIIKFPGFLSYCKKGKIGNKFEVLLTELL